MDINKWLKRKIAIISLAMFSVEKNALSQKGGLLDKSITQERNQNQGTLADSLKQGKITQEVMNLRWRLYKILEESSGHITEIVGYDENGFPITKTKKIDKTKNLSYVSVDKFDSYPLEIVLDNSPIASSGDEAMDNVFIKLYDDIILSKNDEGEMIASHGEITSDDYFATNKTHKPLVVGRMFIPKFEIEKYATKLNVRRINETEKLLEFYISMYPNFEDRKTNLLISDIKKAIQNPMTTTFLDIKEVGFVSHKTIGVNDFLEFKYDIISLDKIIEFNGYYVIKYKATVNINGEHIFEEHRVTELDNKYEKKEAKKQ